MTEQTIITLIAGLLLGAVIVYFILRFRRRRIASCDEGQQFSSQEVENLLKKAGYHIWRKGIKESVITTINGKDHYGYLKADYLVEKLKKRYVVVVKSGQGPADPNEPTMRRRLLEYYRAFNNQGILLVDPHQGEVQTVLFHFPHEKNFDFFFRFLIGLFIVFAVIAIIWLLVQMRLL